MFINVIGLARRTCTDRAMQSTFRIRWCGQAGTDLCHWIVTQDMQDASGHSAEYGLLDDIERLIEYHSNSKLSTKAGSLFGIVLASGTRGSPAGCPQTLYQAQHSSQVSSSQYPWFWQTRLSRQNQYCACKQAGPTEIEGPACTCLPNKGRCQAVVVQKAHIYVPVILQRTLCHHSWHLGSLVQR